MDRPRRRLADRVRAALDGSVGTEVHLDRVSVPLPDSVNPIHWIRSQESTGEAVFWSGRSPSVVSEGGRSLSERSLSSRGTEPSIAAVGQADVLSSASRPVDYEKLCRRLRDRLRVADEAVRYFGGVRFDAAQPSAGPIDSHWRPFGTYRFVLPRFELVTARDRQRLACNLVLPRDRGRAEALLDRLEALSFPSTPADRSLPKPNRRRDRPDREGWNEMVRWALDAIEGRGLDKVVFAREVALGLDRDVDPYLVLNHLKATTPGCFHFALRPSEGPAFVGASPERLFRREGATVVSEAVAGTRKRGKTPEADAALREELLTSDKERREHAFVQRAIERALQGICVSVDGTETPSDLALARGRHLHARVSGTLRSETSTVDLLAALHPTPAVGGVPIDAALRAIRRQEPFDRGWYAGPVGWIGPDAAEFAVAIRSGMFQSSRLALFSGAGIVDGSVPEREWDEIEQKIGDFAAVLGLLDRNGSVS